MTFKGMCSLKSFTKKTLMTAGQRCQPSRHLFDQIQLSKHQNNVWNLFKVNNKDTRRASTSFWYLYY